MSTQRFSAAEREAIWLAHNKKCAYTGRLLDVREFHIDHIIPQSLNKESDEFKNIAAQLNLPKKFDMRGYENLLPCASHVNREKGSMILPQISYWIGIASAQKDKVKAELDRIKKRQDSGRVLILLEQHLERGDLTSDEIAKILQKHTEQPAAIFELIEGMEFANGSEVKFIANANIDSLWDLPVYIDGVSFKNKDGKQILVRNCREYTSACDRGYKPVTNTDFKMSISFKQRCGLLESLQSATTAQRSFISSPKVGVVDIVLLPMWLFPWIEEELDVDELKTATYQDKVRTGELVVKDVSQNSLTIEGYGLGQKLVEVVRADFNGNGIEDILIFESCYAIGGSLGFGGHYILSRASLNGMFEIVT